MSKQRKVKVLNAASETGDYTSPARALTLVAQGRARPVDGWTIEMLDANEQHQAAVRSVAGGVSSTPRRRHSLDIGDIVTMDVVYLDNRQTFLPYPQRDLATHGKERRAA